MQATALRNRQILNQRDPAVRRAHHDELRATAGDAAKHRAFLLRTSMIQSLSGLLDAGGIVTTDSQRLPTRIDSICVHGDGPGAVEAARAIRTALEAAGHRLVTLPERV